MDSSISSKEEEPKPLPQGDPTDMKSEANAAQSVQSEDKDSIEPLNDDTPPEYLHGFKLFIVLVALLLSMFLVSLPLTHPFS